MKNDISKISVSVIVNHTDRTTTVKMSGEKTPVSFIQTVSQSAYTAALRDAAFYLLEKAASLDEKSPYNTRKQAIKMFEEHRSFNEFDTDTGDYEVGDDITCIFCDMGTQDVYDDMIVSARYDRYDLLP